jgi:hypothetical protein
MHAFPCSFDCVFSDKAAKKLQAGADGMLTVAASFQVLQGTCSTRLLRAEACVLAVVL